MRVYYNNVPQLSGNCKKFRKKLEKIGEFAECVVVGRGGRPQKVLSVGESLCEHLLTCNTPPLVVL